MKIANLNDVFCDSLRDIYNAENQLVKALPKMAEAASCEELKAGFQRHLEETKNHCVRLEKVFQLIEQEPKKKKCKAMEGLIKEGEEAIDAKTTDGRLQDELLINAARKVEHYEMAAYCTLRLWAEKMGLSEVGTLLAQTFEEEKSCDASLKGHAAHDSDELMGRTHDTDEAQEEPDFAEASV